MSAARGPKRRLRSGRGALLVVALILAASAAVRVASGTGAAIAREIETLRDAAVEPPMPAPGPASPALPTDAEFDRIVLSLKAREQALAQREAALETRLAALALAETEIAENLARLERAEAELRATIALADAAAETDLARLTAVYENMKPQEAAPVFAAMTPAFAAGFLGRMRADAAAAIMAGLDPEKAYSISVILAGRNAEVPVSGE